MPRLGQAIVNTVVLLLAVSVVRLFVTSHQQAERIEILENSVLYLLNDSARHITPSSASQDSRPHTVYYPRRERPSTDNYPSHSSHSHTDTPSPHPARPIALSPSDSAAQRLQQVRTEHLAQSAEEVRNRKFTEPHPFDINTIDSLTLIRIPGIAGRTASLILRQRNRYGGFYSPWQLRDFLTWESAESYMEEWCTQWFTANAATVRPLRLNTATFSELIHHPYITFEQAKDLTNYRRRHKKIEDVTALQQMPSFTKEEIDRLLPYLSFKE